MNALLLTASLLLTPAMPEPPPSAIDMQNEFRLQLHDAIRSIRSGIQADLEQRSSHFLMLEHRDPTLETRLAAR